MKKFSKYFQRSFALFMDNIHRKKSLEKPTVKDSDIESFFIHVTELKARIEELERGISIHAFDGKSVTHNIHPHNLELLKMCRISEREAYETFGEYINNRERCDYDREFIIR